MTFYLIFSTCLNLFVFSFPIFFHNLFYFLVHCFEYYNIFITLILFWPFEQSLMQSPLLSFFSYIICVCHSYSVRLCRMVMSFIVFISSIWIRHPNYICISQSPKTILHYHSFISFYCHMQVIQGIYNSHVLLILWLSCYFDSPINYHQFPTLYINNIVHFSIPNFTLISL